MFEMKRTVTYSQVGSNLKMDMAGIVHYLQDCTLAHSESIGKGVEEVALVKRAWFLSGWQIEVKRFPEYKEHVTVKTWPHDFKSMYGFRNMVIADASDDIIVKANSIWIFMDLAKMLPAKPSPEDMKGYELEPSLDMDYAARKITILSDEYKVSDSMKDSQNGIVVKKSFVDSNHHVNNGRYVSEAFDVIDSADAKKLRVDYRKAAVLGDVMYPAVYRDGNVTQVVLNDSAGKPYVIVEVIN